MLYLSQMTRDITSLFETLHVTHDKGYDNATDAFSVTHDQTSHTPGQM
jgi:hypothetical protein